jgi:hypothetical protein
LVTGTKGVNSQVRAILLDTESNSVYIVGYSGTHRGLAANRIVKVNAINGDIDSIFFASGINSGFNGKVNSHVFNPTTADGIIARYSGYRRRGIFVSEIISAIK